MTQCPFESEYGTVKASCTVSMHEKENDNYMIFFYKSRETVWFYVLFLL